MVRSHNNSSQLLEKIKIQIDTVGEAIAKSQQRIFNAKSHFDNSLFKTQSKRLKDYLAEIEYNFETLKVAVDRGNIVQVNFLAERLIMQISALNRELATRTLRENEARKDSSLGEVLYQQLARHQDYQRRLKNMLRDKESLLTSTTLASEQKKLQQDIAINANRLARCQSAIKRIERQIEYSETNK